MGFGNINGQPLAVKLLQRSLKNKRLASTYLFHGPQGIGKELTAREFAKSLNCEVMSEDSCGTCRTCKLIDSGKHPDIFWIYPQGASRTITIEQIRQLQKSISWKSYEGKVKVGIIASAHCLNTEAGNALLKTLEEPPNGTILVLVSSSPETILSTIRSRSREIQFFSLPPKIIANLLVKKHGIDKDRALFYSTLSDGSAGGALNLSDENYLEHRRMILDILKDSRFKNMRDLMGSVEKITKNLQEFKENLLIKLKKEDSFQKTSRVQRESFVSAEYRKRIRENLNLIASWYRDILVMKVTKNKHLIINKDYCEYIDDWKNKIEIDTLQNRIQIVDDIRRMLESNVSIKMLLQVMFVKLEML